MAIEKKLICFARLAEFERQLAAGNILDYSIVFIQDAKKIWNRGTYYDCSGPSDVAVYGDGYIESQAMEDGTYLTTNVAENLDAVSARGQLADALDVKTFVADSIPTNVSELNNDSSYTPYNQVMSILSGYVKKETGKGLSTQDFTTELEGKLKGIEANAQKNVQSDWNESDMGSDAYIMNRTHYSYDMEPVATFSVASKNEGDILVTGLNEGVFYRFYGSKSDSFHFVLGRKVIIPAYGPTMEAVCAYDDDSGTGCLKLTTPTYGLTDSFSLMEIHVEQLDDVYVPETIARKAEIATINGQSLTEGGDITIQGGGSYDDSEIREAISQLSAITDNFNSDIANLYNVKQDTLVSGTNIKTINGESILGSGNISISGGNGTITGVSANGTSIATSGVANIPAASTSAYGVTKLSSATNSTSTTLAATASAVKAAYDLASGKASMSDVNTAIANAITTTLNTAV